MAWPFSIKVIFQLDDFSISFQSVAAADREAKLQILSTMVHICVTAKPAYGGSVTGPNP